MVATNRLAIANAEPQQIKSADHEFSKWLKSVPGVVETDPEVTVKLRLSLGSWCGLAEIAAAKNTTIEKVIASLLPDAICEAQ